MLSNQKIEQGQLSIVAAIYIKVVVTNIHTIKNIAIAERKWDEHTKYQILLNFDQSYYE